MERPKISETLQKIANKLALNGYQCYLVGGAVRSHLLHTPVKDYDLATDALPEKVIELFKKVIPTGIKHGTVTIIEDGSHFEITTFRTDGKYSDGRRPDSIQFIPNILEDLKRRDFTINSIAYDLINRLYYDPNNGVSDLNCQLIRAIGEPLERFSEDGLRPLRALRFVAQLGFNLEEKSYEAIKDSLSITAGISRERITEEMMKLCMGAYAPRALFLMRDCGLMELLFPALYQCFSRYHHSDSHHIDLLTYQIYSLEAISPKRPLARVAALFAFIGINDADAHHKVDVQYSGDLFYQLAKAYHLPLAKIAAIAHLIRNQDYHYTNSWSDGDVRRHIALIGITLLDDWFALVEGQRNAFERLTGHYDDIAELKMRVNSLLTPTLAITIDKLEINGSDLMSLGVPKGPKIGLFLNQLLQKVIDEPAINTKAQLLFCVEHLLANEE